MAETAAHLVDHVLPDVPYRQWVLSLPFELRYRVAYDPDLCSATLAAFIAEVDAWYATRAQELGVQCGQWGGLTVLQRFGSDLRLNPHFHTLAVDGVFELASDSASATFHRVAAPTADDIAGVALRVYERVLAELRKRSLLPEDGDAEPDPLALEEPTLSACYAAAVQGRAAFGPNAGRRPMRLGDGGEPIAESLGPFCARSHGFNLHAGVTIRQGDRAGLERLCPYLLRPPLSHDRLERLDEDHIGLRLKTPYRDGTEQIALTHYELLERLCALVHRPRAHRVRYHGLLAPASRHRSLVVPTATNTAKQSPQGPESAPKTESDATPSRKRIRRLLWAELIKRSFGFDPLDCPREDCEGRMKLIATIMKADVIKAILDALGLDSEPPFIQPSRGPPDDEMVQVDWA
jgi:Mn-dependent DtxR family transcriptional regulator